MRHDLIVVGGGPAGATAALFAARAGLSALLLERAVMPRDRVCGDALGADAVAVLRELDLLEPVRALPGVEVRRVLFGSPARVEIAVDLARARRPEAVTGFVIRREIFDSFLFDAAARGGASCRDGFEVVDLLREGGVVCGVRGRDRRTGVPREHRGRVVLGADGCHSIVGRRLGLNRLDPDHTVVGVRAYYRGVAGLSDGIELHFVDEVLPGYLWIFPCGDGVANVGVGMLAAPQRRRGVDLVRTLDALVGAGHFAPRFAQAERLSRTLGRHLPVGSRRRTCSGAGFLLLGDAAGLVDPFTGEGIGNAMRSAQIAVAAIVAAFADGDVGAASLARYGRMLHERLGAELATSARLQRLAAIRPLLNFTIRKAARSPAVADAIGAMISREVPRSALTSPLFYARLLLR